MNVDNSDKPYIYHWLTQFFFLIMYNNLISKLGQNIMVLKKVGNIIIGLALFSNILEL